MEALRYGEAGRRTSQHPAPKPCCASSLKKASVQSTASTSSVCATLLSYLLYRVQQVLFPNFNYKLQLLIIYREDETI